jgi:homoserine kinase
MTPTWAEAWAPASVGNLSVGFDLLGHTLGVAGDRVRVERSGATGVVIESVLDARGDPVAGIPLAPERNTAGAALLAMLRDGGLEGQEGSVGLVVRIRKGIPLGSGMGGSAASAVAALVAANRLRDHPLSPEGLYGWALEGERVASGSSHGDNVGPQLLGGLVLALPDRLLPLALPGQMHCALVHPHQVLETRRSREVLEAPFPMSDIVTQTARLARFLEACHRGEPGLLRGAVEDALVEPRRAPLIHGFSEAQRAARSLGAIGAGISGGGPSVFAWFEGAGEAAAGAAAMRSAFQGVGVEADAWSAPVEGPAARVLEWG